MAAAGDNEDTVMPAIEQNRLLELANQSGIRLFNARAWMQRCSAMLGDDDIAESLPGLSVQKKIAKLNQHTAAARSEERRRLTGQLKSRHSVSGCI